MFWTIILGVGFAYLLQTVLGWRQLREFSNTFVAMRRDGRVAMGKYKGAVVTGAIVMFVLDDDGRIVYGKRMHGISVLARFRAFPLYDGQLMTEIDPQLARAEGRTLFRAVKNARANVLTHLNGGQPAEPLTPLGRLLERLPLGRFRPTPRRAPELSAVLVPAAKPKVIPRAKAGTKTPQPEAVS